MATHISTVSISPLDWELINALELSVSGLLKQRIAEIRDSSSNWKKLLSERESTILNFQKLIKTYSEFIESKNLSGDFAEYVSVGK